jgi:O-Antigen ligase
MRLNTSSLVWPKVHIRTYKSKAVQSSAEYWGRRLIAFVLAIWALAFTIGFEWALAVLTLAALGTAIVGLRRPVGLLGISMLCTMDAVTRVYLMSGGIRRWNTLNYWLLLVIIVSLPNLVRASDIHTRLLQALILFLGLQLIISEELVAGIDHILNISVVFGLLAYFVRARKDKEIWYWLGLLNGILAATGSLVFYLQKDQLRHINPNAWAYFSLTAIFALCLGFHMARKTRTGQFLFMSLAVVNYVWVFLSGSRGGLLVATFCILFLTLGVRDLFNRFAYVSVAVFLAIAISAGFSDLKTNSLHRVDKLLDSSESAANRTSGRSDLALAGWYIFLDHPFGVGTGAFPPAWARLAEGEGISDFRRGLKTDAHSAWIKILAENGVIGILLFSSYVLSFAVVGWRKRRQPLFLLGLMATGALGVAFISTEFQGKGLWFLAAGVTVLLSYKDSAPQLRSPAIPKFRRTLIKCRITPHENAA